MCNDIVILVTHISCFFLVLFFDYEFQHFILSLLKKANVNCKVDMIY